MKKINHDFVLEKNTDLESELQKKIAEKERYREKRENWERDFEKKQLKKSKNTSLKNKKRLIKYKDNYDYNNIDENLKSLIK